MDYQAATFWVIFCGFSLTIATVVFKAGRIQAVQESHSVEMLKLTQRMDIRDDVIQAIMNDLQYVIGHMGLERRSSSRDRVK